MTSDFYTVSAHPPASTVALRLPAMVDSAEFDRVMAGLLEMLDAASGPPRWVLDLSQVDYMGSALLGLLVNIRQRVQRSRGKLVLCRLPPRLAQVLHACSLERLFVIARTREDAIYQVMRG